MKTNQPKQSDGPVPDVMDVLNRNHYGAFRDGALCFFDQKVWGQLKSALDGVEDDYNSSELDSLTAKVHALFTKIECSESLSALLEQTPIVDPAGQPIFHANAFWYREPLVHVADKNCGLGVFLDRPTLEICQEAATVVHRADKDLFDDIFSLMLFAEAEVRLRSRAPSFLELLEEHEKR
jgi:hypothetical protein